MSSQEREQEYWRTVRASNRESLVATGNAFRDFPKRSDVTTENKEKKYDAFRNRFETTVRQEVNEIMALEWLSSVCQVETDRNIGFPTKIWGAKEKKEYKILSKRFARSKSTLFAKRNKFRIKI